MCKPGILSRFLIFFVSWFIVQEAAQEVKGTKKKDTTESCPSLVDDTGLEPVTSRTSSGCSYQLS